MRWCPRRTVLVIGALCLSAGLGLAQSPAPRKVEELERHNEALRRKLGALVAADPVLQDMAKIADPVIVAIRPSMVERLIEEVGFHYLDRVELNLTPNLHIHHVHELTKKTFLGKVKGGDLTVNIDVRAIRGLMRSKPPQVDFAGANRVDLTVSVRIAQGEGVADFSVRWDSAGLASLVCKDFEFKDKLQGTIVPGTYTVAGHFNLEATPQAIIARPRFEDQKFKLRLDLTAGSWAKVQKAIEAQDTFGKCGIGINPPQIMEKLKELGQRGFDIKVPKSLLRPVNLPASVEQEVNVQNNIVRLSVKPGVLGIDKDAIVFSSAVSTSVAAMAIRPPGAARPGTKPSPAR